MGNTIFTLIIKDMIVYFNKASFVLKILFIANFYFFFAGALLAQKRVNMNKNDFINICIDIANHREVKKLFKDNLINEKETVCFDLQGFLFNEEEILYLAKEYLSENKRYVALTIFECYETDWFNMGKPIGSILKATYVYLMNNELYCSFIYIGEKDIFLFSFIYKNYGHGNWKKKKFKKL